MSSFNLLRKTKKPSQPKEKKPQPIEEPAQSAEELDRAIFSQAALGVSNWADDSEDDEGYAPVVEEAVQPGWSKAAGTGRTSRAASKALPVASNEIHQSDPDDDDEEDMDLEAELGVELAEDEEDEQREPEHPSVQPSGGSAHVVKPPTEPEKQLSKRELKKKEMEELDAVFAEFGIAAKEAAAANNEAPQEEKKKKKKAKQEGEPGVGGAAAAGENNQASAQEEEEDTGPVDPAAAKARLLAAAKKADAKKKAVSAVALAEAKARKAKLSKQKDTKSFNQMPSRGS